MPKVSVIVPIYNAEKYLHICIQSILEQTLKDIEVILVNDGSTDNSSKIAEQFSRNDDRIVFINISNQGASNARNIGIKEARGEYIGFVDSDDWIESTMFEELYISGSLHNCDIVICDHEFKYSKNGVKRGYEVSQNTLLDRNKIEDEILSGIITGNFNTTCWDKIYKRELLIDNKIYFKQLPKFEDLIFLMNVFSYAKRTFYIPRKLYNYRVVEGSLSNKYYNNYLDLILNVHQEKLKYIKKWKIDSSINLEVISFFDDIFECINKVVSNNKKDLLSVLQKLESDELFKYMSSKKYIVFYLKNSSINKVYGKIILYGLKNNNIRSSYHFINVYNWIKGILKR